MPACSCAPQELSIAAGGDLLGKLAAMLGTQPGSLVMWGHVGHKVQPAVTACQPTEPQPESAETKLDGSCSGQTGADATIAGASC